CESRSTARSATESKPARRRCRCICAWNSRAFIAGCWAPSHPRSPHSASAWRAADRLRGRRCEARAPQMDALGLDTHDQILLRAAQNHRAVLRILVAQAAQGRHVLLGSFDDPRASVNQDEGQMRPVLLVMIDQQRDARVLGDIAHPLERRSGPALGLLVDYEVEIRGVEPETDRN